jgi:hypothetical protein
LTYLHTHRCDWWYDDSSAFFIHLLIWCQMLCMVAWFDINISEKKILRFFTPNDLNRYFIDDQNQLKTIGTGIKDLTKKNTILRLFNASWFDEGHEARSIIVQLMYDNSNYLPKYLDSYTCFTTKGDYGGWRLPHRLTIICILSYFTFHILVLIV